MCIRDRDKEGLYIMRQIGENMTWMLKMLESAKANGIAPTILEKERTNFIRQFYDLFYRILHDDMMEKLIDWI